MSKEKTALIVKNKNASRNFKLDESFQAGIVLEGWEVKSLRDSKVDVKNSYVNIRKGEAWLIGVKIDSPASLQQENIDTTKSRKLLLHKKEIAKIERLKGEKGLTCVLTKIYWKDNLIKCDIAIPCATQNELGKEDAMSLIKNGCNAVGEGANMPCTPDAVEQFTKNKVLYAPGKASNAGGVAVSGLEMAQNSLRYTWTRDVVDGKLKEIMSDIHASCVKYGSTKDEINYLKGANIAGFVKVADAMLAQGVV